MWVRKKCGVSGEIWDQRHISNWCGHFFYLQTCWDGTHKSSSNEWASMVDQTYTRCSFIGAYMEKQSMSALAIKWDDGNLIGGPFCYMMITLGTISLIRDTIGTYCAKWFFYCHASCSYLPQGSLKILGCTQGGDYNMN